METNEKECAGFNKEAVVTLKENWTILNQSGPRVDWFVCFSLQMYGVSFLEKKC